VFSWTYIPLNKDEFITDIDIEFIKQPSSKAEYIIAIEVEDGHDMPKADEGTLETTILESFGMSLSYKWVIRINSWVGVVACVWVYLHRVVSFLNETLITAGVTMIVLGPRLSSLSMYS